MNDGVRENVAEMMTNEEYREELARMFSEIDENYKLRWFYLFVKEKTRGSK